MLFIPPSRKCWVAVRTIRMNPPAKSDAPSHQTVLRWWSAPSPRTPSRTQNAPRRQTPKPKMMTTPPIRSCWAFRHRMNKALTSQWPQPVPTRKSSGLWVLSPIQKETSTRTCLNRTITPSRCSVHIVKSSTVMWRASTPTSDSNTRQSPVSRVSVVGSLPDKYITRPIPGCAPAPPELVTISRDWTLSQVY